MWKLINSPIIIAVLIIISIISYDRYRKSSGASEIRGVYNEIISISEDATGDLEKKKLITSFVKEAGKQIREGFGSFNGGEQKNKQAPNYKNQIPM